ncbi:MAG TPA: hypothetical protein PLE61_15845 [Vicinamibacterales bacterium]|nr:hypothetical protein [Vicinamibacterales bacterium]
MQVATRYAVVEAGDVLESTDPGYLRELQPRDTDRAAREGRVGEIAAKLDPEMLGENPLASDGAPIVGPDAMVETGNTRVAALRRVYSSGTENASRYRSWLVESADRFGLDRAQIEAMQSPVLVRVRETPLDDAKRVEFVRQANESTTARMSSSEQAQVDADLLTPDLMGVFNPSEDGDVATESNLEFTREFLRRLGSRESAALVTADGRLNTDGIRRIRNAVFAKAYGNAEVIARLAEDPDDAIKNVTKAMLLAVHRLAAVRSSVEQGNLHNIDLTPALAEAAGKLAALREQGIPVERYLAERGLFGEELSQEAKVLLALFDRNKRSAKRIASYLTTFADGVEARGNPQNRSMFGDDTVPTVGEVLAAAIRKVDREHGAEGVAGSSGAPGGLFEGQDLGGRSTGAGAGGFAQQIADAVWNSPIRPPGAGQAASEELTPPRDPSAPLFQAANIGLTPQQHRQRILEGYDAGKFTLDTPGLPESVAAFVRRERPDGPQRPVEPSPGPATAPNAPEAGSAPAAPETEQVQGGTNLATVAAYRERTGREERPAVTPDTNAAQIARGREIAAAPERVDAIINRGVAGQQLTADEQAALGVVMDDAEARADAIRERARTLPEGSREWRAAMEEWEAADARVFRMGLAVENTGTAIARALQFRAARFLNHFDYHRVIHRATVANGGDALNAEQRAAFDDLTRRLAEADQRLADALAEGRDLRAALAETRRGAEEAARRFERETRQRERKPAPRQGERPPRPKPTQEQKDAKRLERLRDRRKEIIARLRESGLQPREGVRILNQDGRFTPAFWRWFGESKVVDDQGQPLVVYHGTDASFSEFGVGRRSTEDMHPGGPIGHFFTAEPDVAGDYADYASFSRTGDVKGPNGQNIIPVHLSIQNPYEVSGYEWDRGDFIPEGSSPEDVISIRSDLQAEGYDGLIIRRSYGTEYVAFSPTQIKSAIGNAGTYDPTNPSILHQDAPASAIPGLTPKQVADLYALSRVLIEEQIASGGAVDLDGVAEGIREAFPMLDDLQVWEAIRGPRKGRAKPDLPGRKEMIERDSLRHEINRRVEVIKFARLPRGAKLLYGAAHAGNAMRSMMASFDMSWLLRQGAVLATAHPGIARRAFGESLRAWADADTARAAYLELTELPQNLDAMTPQQGVHALRILRRTNAGLQLTDPEGTMIEREEDFATNFFSRLKRIPGLALYVKGIEGSERAYSTGLNKLRADTFDHYADLLDEQGAATPENLRALANYINIATGRGNLGSLAPAARQLAAVFFAPRYAISRFQLLGTLVRAPAPVRALIARDLVRWFGANMGILSLAVLAGASVEWDPRNSDWGQIRIGNSRADLWAGFRQVGVALARLVTGKIAYTEGGQNIERATQRDRVIMRFVQSKLSPLTSLMWEAIEGRTFTYKPFEWGPAIVERTIPIGAREMPETLKERGPVGGAALSALNLLGVGVNTYDNRASSHRRPENDSRVMTADEYARYLGAGGPRTR